MTKVTSPLFGAEAHGRIGEIGSFRRGRHGPEFIQHPKTRKVEAGPQPIIRACFQAAKAAHSAIPPIRIKIGDRWVKVRLPRWPEFWRQWLIDHPECRP